MTSPIQESLRPQLLEDFFGQSTNKRILNRIIRASQLKDEALPHILLQGPSGYGKTTLAYILANELGVQNTVIMAPGITNTQDLASRLQSVRAKSIVFIDEVHRLTKGAQESLYSVLEDQQIEYKDKYMDYTRLIPLNKFTLIAATTEPGSLTIPFRGRFRLSLRMQSYDQEELTQIIRKSGEKLNLVMDSEAVDSIRTASRGTPRQVNHLLESLSDYTLVEDSPVATGSIAKEMLEDLGISESGMTDDDRQVMIALLFTFSGGPVGIESLAITSGVDVEMIRTVCEPFLMEKGYIERTSKGRVATPQAAELLSGV